MSSFALRQRKVRILATLGPASANPETIEQLCAAGADAFRINMSHGEHHIHAQTIATIRDLEEKTARPTTILVDLQGPKLRIGTFADGAVELVRDAPFALTAKHVVGDSKQVHFPHPDLYTAIEKDARLLLDDGKLVLRVTKVTKERIDTIVEIGGTISDRKGVNIPDIVVPLSALTDKDRRDLDFALAHGADWIALSFVQRPEDVAEARKLIKGRAALLVKFEKPAAIDRYEEILEGADAAMVARGDLGVELPPYELPPLQKRIVASARRMGKPVVVATQMLESMIQAPTPTRAEVSDVATAIYDGADAIMLSAETAAGKWPVQAVTMMDNIARSVEADPDYRRRLQFTETKPDPTTADALAEAAGRIIPTIDADGILCFTASGATARRVARERPASQLVALTPKREVARRMGILWGVYAVTTRDIGSFEEMIAKGKRMALRHHIGKAGSKLVMIAGVPFGMPGATNVLHVATLTGDELRDYDTQPLL